MMVKFWKELVIDRGWRNLWLLFCIYDWLSNLNRLKNQVSIIVIESFEPRITIDVLERKKK